MTPATARAPLRPGRSRARGVSLVEALVAMAVMAFGMLSLVGVQATLRLNADIARQRSEATRMAQEEMESLRAFVSVQPPGGSDLGWQQITTVAERTVEVPAANASFTLTRSVSNLDRSATNLAGSAQRQISVTVSWVDRVGQSQSVALYSTIAGASPVLSGLLTVAATSTAASQRAGRHPTIPVRAQDLGNGESGFKPVEGGTVAWTFNNVTGVITSVCTVSASVSSSALTAASLSGSCVATTAQLLAGNVWFNLRGASRDLGSGESVLKPVAGGTTAWVLNNSTRRIVRSCTVGASTTTQTLTAADVASAGGGCSTAARDVSPFDASTDASRVLDASDSESPLWPALRFGVTLTLDSSSTGHSASPQCYVDGPASSTAALASDSVAYFCIVYPNAAMTWGGRSELVPSGFSDGNGAAWTISSSSGEYKVCRYTTASSDYTANTDHPRDYCKVSNSSCTSLVSGNLVNQNFLVIAQAKTCPTDVAATPSTGDLVNTNTRQHQP